MPTPGNPSRPKSYAKSGNKRMSVPILIAILVGVAVIITVIVGNILNVRLDDETYYRLTGKKTTVSDTEENIQLPEVPTDVKAYPYELGKGTGSLAGRDAVSVSINTPSGQICYSSPVAKKSGTESTQSLERGVDRIVSANISYLSGVFYPQDLSSIDDENLRYKIIADEACLLREFLSVGGSEIVSEVVLVGMDVSAEGITQTLSYLQQLRMMLGNDARIGIAVPLSIASSSIGWEVIHLLQSKCFCLLDLRETTDDTLENDLIVADYYLTELNLRLLFTSDQTTLVTLVTENEIRAFQIVTKPAEGQ